MRCFAHLLFVLLIGVTTLAAADETPAPEEPVVFEASDEPRSAMQSIRLPEGFRVELFAAEPMLANPVSFGFDEQGRVYVCETFRQGKGVEDNRGHMNWLDDDLAAQTVEDRLAYLKKNLGDKVNEYTRQDDRLRRLEDTDQDGVADRATVFANRFNGILDGTGAGVLAYRGNVYYTCIPELWLLRDENGDGQADVRKSLHHGYGVRYAFRGHDLHGLRVGPDGKLYFSMGDRGYNLDLGERKFVNPDSGAIFRCDLDGSNLEVIATGLRNPQELAFDQYGNLFTGDNNSDGGDRARWVYVVEGMDAGWRMYYQYLNDRGPWNQEKLWHPRFDGQAAYIVPPIANIGDGPSGLAYDPGVGLPERWRNHFFMVDFRGTTAQSGIRAISVKPHGATFEIDQSEEFMWSLLATDVDFSPDGQLYATDWVEGWNGPGKGRIYRFPTDDDIDRDVRDEAAKLIAGGVKEFGDGRLVELLSHPDMRVRLEAQFELAIRPKAAELFGKTLLESKHQLTRIHAIWGLRMILPDHPASLTALVAAAEDDDAEIRAQIAKALGDVRGIDANVCLLKFCQDRSRRVRSFAAISLGKQGDRHNGGHMLSILADNADQDPVLRHAAVMGLAGSCTPQQLIERSNDPSSSIRMGIALALRRHASPLVAKFLHDPEPLIVAEAARAIYDLPISDAMEELAKLADQPGNSDPVLRRVLNANYRLGGAEHAARVARLAANPATPDDLRIDALRSLQDWAEPSGRDRMLGAWRPLDKRDAAIAADALKPVLAGVFSGPDRVRRAGARSASRLGIQEVGPTLVTLVVDQESAPASRAEAIEALAALQAKELPLAVDRALADTAGEVRAAARTALVTLDKSRALDELERALTQGETVERQAALQALGTIDGPRVDAVLNAALDQLLAGQMPAEVQLDVLTSAGARADAEVQAKLKTFEASLDANDPLAAYRVSLAGGNAERGQQIFFTRSEVSCQRCHKIAGRGGDVGPDLSQIAAMKDRNYLLEAILQPSAQIAKGYETVIVGLDDGRLMSGVLRGEDEQSLQLVTAEGKLLTIDKSTIDERASGPSAMPDTVAKFLTKSELRDLVEYLASLK